MYLKFLAQYQLEVIITLALLVLLLLYILLKKRLKKKKASLEIQAVIPDEYEQDEKNNKTQKDIYDTEVEVEKEEVEVVTVQKPVQNISHNFKKQIVPPHEKIKKEDFSRFSGMHILLAEDNIINQKVILGLLGDSGINIEVADDGQEALNILEKNNNFTLILMDAHMPNIDGFEATRIIRKNPKYDHIVVVALSGDTASDDIKKMKDAGMSETLEKPLKMDALYDILYAYNTREPKQNKENSPKNNTIALNIKEGLNICANDQELYQEVLNEFLNNYANSSELLNSFIQKNNYNEADKLLLDIAGVTANLGANTLHDIALKIKESLKKENQPLSSILQNYQEELQKTVNEIKIYIQDNS